MPDLVVHDAPDAPPPLTPDEIAGIFASHRLFLSTVFDLDLWHMQREIADALDRYDVVGVKACHASGKTLLAAAIGLSFLARYPDAIVISSAPTWTQVEKLLWGEVHSLVKRARFVSFPVPLATELKIDEKNYFIGYSTNDSVRFHGWHAPHGLVILDEDPGILPEIHDAIDGIKAGGRWSELRLGNPVIASGPFYELFGTKKRRFAKLFTISAFDTPNLAGCFYDDGTPETRIAMRLPPPPGTMPVNFADVTEPDDPRLAYCPREYLTTRKWVWQKITEWGILSPPFQARVLGKFPDNDPSALIGLGLIEDAADAGPAIEAGDALDIGIDVAGPGDDETVMKTLVGDTEVRTRAWPTGECEHQVIAAIREDERRYGRVARHVGIDVVGIGHYFANTVANAGIKVTRINVSERAVGYEEDGAGRRVAAATIYEDQKAQRYYRMRARFVRHGMHGITDDETVAQLLSLRVEPTDKGKLAIESKKKRRRRGLPSPDRAEALMCAQYLPDLDKPTRGRTALAGSVSYG